MLVVVESAHMQFRTLDNRIAPVSVSLRICSVSLSGVFFMLAGCEHAADKSSRLIAEGLVLAEQGDHSAAFVRFEQARTIDVSSVRPWVASAELATDLGDYLRAERDFTEAMRLEPANVQWQQKRAEVRQLAGLTEEAKGDYSAVVERDPSRTGAWYNRGSLHATEGNLPRAQADLEQALTRDDSAKRR